MLSTGWALKNRNFAVFWRKNLRNFFSKSDLLGIILCKKSIVRIPKPWKCFLDPDSGKGLCVTKRKWAKSRIFFRKNYEKISFIHPSWRKTSQKSSIYPPRNRSHLVMLRNRIERNRFSKFFFRFLWKMSKTKITQKLISTTFILPTFYKNT